MVLQEYSAKGYFTNIPQIVSINIEEGNLNFEFENNTDTTKTFYVRSAEYDDVIKNIYMILLDKSDMKRITK